MRTIILFATIITLLVFIIRMIIKIISHKNIAFTIRAIIIIIMSYFLLWIIFYCSAGDKPVALGSDICFDDWCATVTKIESPLFLGNGDELIKPFGQFIILQVKMSNYAKGIAQKPSEPRVHIIDGQGHSWAFSQRGQQTLEKSNGKQIPIDERLELHQSLQTQLVFDVPKDAKKLKVLIEEGPFITKLLLPEDNEVFILQ
jgi:hypothetical protein